MSPAVPPPPSREPHQGQGPGPWRNSDPGQGSGPWRGQGPWTDPGPWQRPAAYGRPTPPPRPHPAAYGAPHSATYHSATFAAPYAPEPPQDDPALPRLRAARRRPVFTVAGAVVALYLLNALLASEARGVMAVRIAGPLNTGLAMSLVQCLTTVWAVRWYNRHARTHFDPGPHPGDRFGSREDAR
ncbi:DUF485 domain-containing protein [Streptomyces sp. NPDC086766]|uniref:DUF485 domain-containing protein n=1 Tax=Streptomyces sp. NPDC086766 TaxID=3365754 RepID=UPI00382199B3